MKENNRSQHLTPIVFLLTITTLILGNVKLFGQDVQIPTNVTSNCKNISKSESTYDGNTVSTIATKPTVLYDYTHTFLIGAMFNLAVLPYPYYIKVNFGDGYGYQLINPHILFTVTYPNYGKKTISITTNGISYDSCSFYVFEPTAIPDIQVNRPSAYSWNGIAANYEITVLFGYGNTSIRKPVLFVEGFDPSNNYNYGAIYWKLHEQNLVNRIRSAGYDIIIMNYGNGGDYIQRNGLGLVDLIEWVNANKTTTEDIVVVGASMGGLVSRYALLYMENHGLQHHARMLVTFDSPHQGANIPLGDQLWLNYWRTENTSAQSGIDMLNTQAAQQLLVYHYNYMNDGNYYNNIGCSPLRTELMNELSVMGNYPTHFIKNIAIANGNGTQLAQMGNTNRLQAQDKIMRFEYGAVGDQFYISCHAFAVPNKYIYSDWWTVFYGYADVPYLPPWSPDPIHLPQTVIKVKGTLSYDNAPGGWRNTQGSILNGDAPAGTWSTDDSNHCFVPTISALDLRSSDPSTPLSLFYNIDGSVIKPGIDTPFDGWCYETGENTEHVTVTQTNADYFLDQLTNYKIKIPIDFETSEWYLKENTVAYSQDVSSPVAERVKLDGRVTPHSGYYMYKVSGNDYGTANNGYCYWNLTTNPIDITDKTYLSFWRYVSTSPNDMGRIFIDGVTSDGINLRDWNLPTYIYDQYGTLLHPSSDRPQTSSEGWRQYIVNLSPLAGKKVNLMIGYDDGNPAEMGTFTVYFDDIEINGFKYPINVHGVLSSATSATIKWTDDNDGEESFAVWWRKSDQPTFSEAPNLIVDAAGGTGSVIAGEATGLEPGVMYFFMVKAKYAGFYTATEKQIYLTIAAPEQGGFAGSIANLPVDGKPYVKLQLMNCRNSSYVNVERKIDNGNWEVILTTKSGWEENESIEYNEIVDFNHLYTYRAKAYNVLGIMDYTCYIGDDGDGSIITPPIGETTTNTELPINTTFVAPQISINSFNAENYLHCYIDLIWTDMSNPIFSVNQLFSTNLIILYKKVDELIWHQGSQVSSVSQIAEVYEAGFILSNLSPLSTYEIKLVKNWYGQERQSNIVSVFVPYNGYTDHNNARRLFRTGDGTLHAAFYNDSLVYHAKSTDNGLGWAVENPGLLTPVNPWEPAYGIKGPHPAISVKISDNSVYSIRAKRDSLLLDSLGQSEGFGKVIQAGGKRKLNPAMVTDNFGNIHCVWAETTFTEKVIVNYSMTEYHKFDTVRIYYAKKTATGWEAPRIIEPIQSDSSGIVLGAMFFGGDPGFPPINIPKPSIVISYSGSTVTPHISWEHQRWNCTPYAANIWTVDTQRVYVSKNLLIGEAVSPTGYIAENQCLGVNPSGTVCLTYQQTGDIYRSTNNGSTWSMPYNVSNNTGSSQMPTVAYDKGGAMHILWFDNSVSGFVQKTSTLPVGTDAKLAIAKLTELLPGEESIIWEDSTNAAIDTLNPTISKVSTTEALTTTVNATQIFYRRYKDNAWSPIYRLTASEEPSVYPSLPLTDDAAQMGFIWTEGNGVKYKRLPDLDAPTVAVTYPNGGEMLYSGRRYNITWSSADNRGLKEYVLYYTTNYIAQDDPTAIDAVTLWHSVATVPGNLNSYSWRVPYNVASTACRFKVVAYDSSGNIATDISDKSFTIKSRDIAVVVTDKAIAYNNAGKIARSSDGLLHVCYNGIDSVYYMASSDDGQTWATSLALDKGSLPTIATDSKNMPAMAWIKQWDNIAGGGVFFSRQTAAGWTAPETLAYMQGVLWDYIGGYSPPAMTIKNDTVSLVYEYSYGGGIPPHIAKGWALHHARFAVNNIAGKKDTTIDSYTEIVNPPIWQTPASASIATDYKGYDHISWHRTDKVYYRIRKPDGNYGNIVQLSGMGIAQNPCISISGVASAVWVEEGDIYQRTGFDQKWAAAVNVSASGANSMMPYTCGSDVLWTEDVLSDYEVYLSSYSTAKMTYDVSENLSCTDYASIFPHETKLQTNEGTKTYRIWAEEIEPAVLWGLTFMADTAELEPTYALDAGQAEPSIFTVQRDGYITYVTTAKAKSTVTEPFKTVDYDTTALIYSFDNFDPAKKYKITLSFYQETGQEIKLKPIINKQPLGEIKVTSGEEAILDKPLSEASYKDGQVILTIEKVKGPIAVCGKILIYENPTGQGHGGAQSTEITSITPNYINKLYQNCPNPFNRKTSFNYQIKNQGQVTFKVYNALGQLVNTLVNETKPAGAYQVEWDGKDGCGRQVSSGVYLYRINTGSFEETKKLVVLK